jgi:hypothetical protein
MFGSGLASMAWVVTSAGWSRAGAIAVALVLCLAAAVAAAAVETRRQHR